MYQIEETYRIVDRQDPTRERGLVEIVTNMTEGGPLSSQYMRILMLGDEVLVSGDYKLEFVKKLKNPDLYRQIRRSFNQLVSVNDTGPQC